MSGQTVAARVAPDPRQVSPQVSSAARGNLTPRSLRRSLNIERPPAPAILASVGDEGARGVNHTRSAGL